MSKVIIGTSGYSYNDWRGVLYPQGTKQSDFLKIYASEFGVAELNFSYYRITDAKLIKKMVDETASDFVFSIKAYKSLTHEILYDKPGSDVALFVSGIEPAIVSGKLGVILLQFPFSFHYNNKNRTYLSRLYEQFQGLPLAVEFRNSQWQRESVYQGVRKRNITLVNVDEPQIHGLLKPEELVTSQTGYVRFHGRNSENWWDGNNVTRYDYLYNDVELTEWVPRIKKMAGQTNVLLVVFNNHSKGQAVLNARRLKEILDKNGSVVT